MQIAIPTAITAIAGGVGFYLYKRAQRLKELNTIKDSEDLTVRKFDHRK